MMEVRGAGDQVLVLERTLQSGVWGIPREMSGGRGGVDRMGVDGGKMRVGNNGRLWVRMDRWWGWIIGGMDCWSG